MQLLRNKLSHGKIILLSVCLFAFFIRIQSINQMGRAMDEDYILEKGYKFVDMFVSRDFSNPYWWSIPDHPPLANYIYGISAKFDSIGFDSEKKAMDRGFSGVSIFPYALTISRLVAILFSVLTIYITTFISLKYFGRISGIATGVILSTIPFFVGLSQNANLDIIFSFFFTATVAIFLLYLEKPTYQKAIFIGIFLGCLQLTKQTGIIMYPLLISFYLLQYFMKLPDRKVGVSSHQPHSKSCSAAKNEESFHPRAYARGFQLLLINSKNRTFNFKSLVVIFIASLTTVGVLWPMPFFHLPKYFSFTKSMWLSSGGYPEWFLGHLRITPIFYYVLYFLISIPLLILFLFAYGLKRAISSKRIFLYQIILWLFIPLVVQSLYKGRQHQLRYVVEIYAPLAIIAGYGFSQLLSRIQNKKAKIATFVILLLYCVLTLAKITPYYLSYFNEIVGGTNTVFRNKSFQMGFGGEGLGEATNYLTRTAVKNSSVAVCADPSKNVNYSAHFRFTDCDIKKNTDYIIVNYYIVIRDGFDEGKIRKGYKLVYTVYADKAELVHVYKKI